MVELKHKKKIVRLQLQEMKCVINEETSIGRQISLLFVGMRVFESGRV